MVSIDPVYGGGEKPVAAVIFIHGLGGSAYTTWKSDVEDDTTFWPGWLQKEFPSFAVYTIGYDASKTSWLGGHSQEITDRADGIHQLLKTMQSLQGLPLVWVGHSMGGLVAKSILRKSFDEGDPKSLNVMAQTKGVVFIATPHAGSDVARLASIGRAIFRPSVATKNMLPDNANLRDLNQWYRNNSVRSGIDSLGFAETKSTSGFQVVDASSADVGITGVSTTQLDGDHIEICKPSNRESQLYRQIVHFLGAIRDRICSAAAEELSRSQGSSDEDRHHGYQLTRWTEPFPECAQLHVEPQQGTNQSMINATAIVRCNRQRISKDDEIERAFYLSARSVRLTIDVTEGEVDWHIGSADQNSDRPCELTRIGNVLTFDAYDGMPFLKGTLYRNEWLPKVIIHSSDRCEVSFRIGAYSEAINLDIFHPDHLQPREVSDLKMKLMRVVAYRALERVDDQIILSRTDVTPAERG